LRPRPLLAKRPMTRTGLRSYHSTFDHTKCDLHAGGAWFSQAPGRKRHRARCAPLSSRRAGQTQSSPSSPSSPREPSLDQGSGRAIPSRRASEAYLSFGARHTACASLSVSAPRHPVDPEQRDAVWRGGLPELHPALQRFEPPALEACLLETHSRGCTRGDVCSAAGCRPPEPM
jgi:hypothetical protein